MLKERSGLGKAISSLAASRIRCVFDDATISEAGWAVPDRIRPEDLVDRVDLRDKHFLTIDPPSARDFDDALFVESLAGNRFRIWVAIADVSHYVPQGSAMDEEARLRGLSVYLPDRVVPMLPESLSSNLCSLVPRQDRLALVARMETTPNGAVDSAAFMAAVIRSRERLTYEEVALAIGGDLESSGQRKCRQHMRQLSALAGAAESMRRHRVRRGVLGFDFPESKIVFDQMDPSRVIDVVAGCHDQTVKMAHSMVEEMMLATNEAVGRALRSEKRSGIWRVHPPPDPDSLKLLASRLSAYGVKCDRRKIKSRRGLSSLVTRLTKKKSTRVLASLVLRAMNPASYESQPGGHFGLASETYLHFTSPIRRYADLQVHREFKKLLRDLGFPAGGCKWGSYSSDPEDMVLLAEQLSEAEYIASKTERKSRSVCSASLLETQVGKEFDVLVSGLADFGFFVSVGNPSVEGLVRFKSMKGWFELDVGSMMVRGRGDSKISLGDRMRVRLEKVDVPRGHIDFVPMYKKGER